VSIPIPHLLRHPVLGCYVMIVCERARRIAGHVLLSGLFCSILLLSASATAAEISIPLKVPLALLRAPLTGWAALPEQAPRELYRKGSCRYFQVGNPVLEQRPDGLHFVTRVAGRWALEIAGRCIGLSAWSGTADLELVPVVGDDGRLRLQISHSTLRDEAGRSAPLLGFIVNLSKRFINSRIEAFSYDLTPPREEVMAVLRDCVPMAILPSVEETLHNLRLGKAALAPDTVTVPLILTIPDAWREPPPPRPAVAPMDETAIRTLEQDFEPLDAFVVFVVKRAGIDLNDPELRERLFELLLESRYRLVEILSGEVEGVSGDPLRELFIADWEDLRALIDAAAQRGLIRGRLLDYALFINAGDVLLAIDREAPGLGVDITSDGLRRLAGALQPGVSDPLIYDLKVDPELRRLFDFGPDDSPNPPASPMPESSAMDRLLARLFSPAYAGEAAADTEAELGKRLDRWVPGSAQLTDYQRVVDALLRLTADRQLQKGELKAAHADIYRHLLPATALIESCWRQFVREDGKVTYLKSSAGSIGMMQINQFVWRGFYEIERLKWDVSYNVRAGAEILMRYLKTDAIPLAETTGNANHIPRAAYCVYNAGPKAVRRFLNAKGSARARAVDDRLWTLYQGIAAGGTVELQQCGVDSLSGQAAVGLARPIRCNASNS
jgi:hypothetical protein